MAIYSGFVLQNRKFEKECSNPFWFAHPQGKLGVSLVEQTDKGSTLFFKLPFTSPFPAQPNAELTVKSCNLWNTLPLSLRKAESFTFFEKELFKYFLLNNNANIIYLFIIYP